MKIECIKDVVVSGITVYVTGEEYDCEVKRDETGKLISHEITGECGMGVFLAGDPSLAEYFKVEKEAVAPVASFTPKAPKGKTGLNILKNLFKKTLN